MFAISRSASRSASRSGKIAAAGVLATLAAASTVGAPQASASTTLGTPVGVHPTAITASSFTIGLPRTPNAEHYRLFASTTRSSVYVGNESAAKASPLTTSPTMSMAGLAYTTAPYYYRVETLKGTSRRWSDIFSLGLRPAVPTKVKASSPAAGTFLTWNSGAATGYQIAQGTNYTQTTARHIYTIQGAGHQFSPYSMAKGKTYYFRVQALNGATGSGWSPLIAVKPTRSQQVMRTMTYNVLLKRFDGTQEGGQAVSPWSQRQIVAANLIKENNPDVVAVQEAADWTGAVKGDRQIDSLRKTLAGIGSQYTLAATEVPPSQSNYFRTGNYLLVKTSTYTPVGASGYFTLPGNVWAAYQLVRNRTTWAKVLVVSPHLTVAAGADGDNLRQQEMTDLVNKASAVAAKYAVGIIYAGDFNSTANRNHVVDGPGVVARQAHLGDAGYAAQALVNTRFNSANQYLRLALASGDRIDHIYTSPGVAIHTLKVALHLSADGKFIGVMASDHNALVADVLIAY